MRLWAVALLLGLAACAAPPPEPVRGEVQLDAWCPAGLAPRVEERVIDDRRSFLVAGCESKPGIPHGPTIVSHFESQRIFSLMFFEDGKLHGPSIMFCESGEIWQQHTFVQGEAEGPSYLWDCDTRAMSVSGPGLDP